MPRSVAAPERSISLRTRATRARCSGVSGWSSSSFCCFRVLAMARKEGGRRQIVAVAAERAGERLDRVLASSIESLSRTRLKALILDGAVTIGGRTILDPGQRVNAGDVVAVDVPLAEDPAPEGQNIPLNIVYEDDDLVVIDKPAGLVVHPAPGNRAGTLVNALIHHCGKSLSGIGGVKRPGIVHRLDKD